MRLKNAVAILVLFVFIGWLSFIAVSIVRDSCIRNDIGNYLYSKRDVESKLEEGASNCNCQSFELNIGNRAIARFESVLQKIKTPRFTIKRFLHFTVGLENPYPTTWLPNVKYGKGVIIKNGTRQKVKVKLTGGQIDHFDTERVSIRIKSNTPIIDSIYKVNFCNPKARLGGLHEWFSHKLMESAGLLLLRTGYANLRVNGKDNGIYFYQEQPAQQMLLAQNRNPGLILRLWHWADEKNNRNHVSISNNYDSKSIDSEVLTQQQNLIDNMIVDYNAGLIKVGEFFSLPKLARYAAVIDLVNGYHAGIWNIYFYLNPKDSLLEPIAREFAVNYFTANSIYSFPFLLQPSKFAPEQIDNGTDLFLYGQIILSGDDKEVFRKHYYEHLFKITEKTYIDQVFSKLDKELKKRQYCLFMANPEYPEFSKDHYFENQILIREYLSEQKTSNRFRSLPHQ